MTTRVPASLLAIAAVLIFDGGVRAEDRDAVEPAPLVGEAAMGGKSEQGRGGAAKDETKTPKLKPGTVQLATFGGGCFWCTEAVFERVPGVMNVVSGYSGGPVPFPTYAMVSTGTTGHAEAVQIAFDPALVSYEKLLEVFWRTHDPTTPNAQGPDVGTQYRSIILYHNDAQKKAAETVYKALKARRVLRGTVVTELVPFQAFFPAEPYHQNYYANHPFEPYSMVYITAHIDELDAMNRKAKPKPKKKNENRRAAH